MLQDTTEITLNHIDTLGTIAVLSKLHIDETSLDASNTSLKDIEKVILFNANGNYSGHLTRTYDIPLPHIYSDNYVPMKCQGCNQHNCFCFTGIKHIISDAFEHLDYKGLNEDDFRRKLYTAFEDLEMLEIIDVSLHKLQIEMVISSLASIHLQGPNGMQIEDIKNGLSMSYNSSEKDYYRFRLNNLICHCNNKQTSFIQGEVK